MLVVVDHILRVDHILSQHQILYRILNEILSNSNILHTLKTLEAYYLLSMSYFSRTNAMGICKKIKCYEIFGSMLDQFSMTLWIAVYKYVCHIHSKQNYPYNTYNTTHIEPNIGTFFAKKIAHMYMCFLEN